MVYWAFGVLIALGFYLLKADTVFILIASLWIVQGLYLELERKGFRWEMAGFLSVGLGTVFSLASSYWVLAKHDLLET